MAIFISFITRFVGVKLANRLCHPTCSGNRIEKDSYCFLCSRQMCINKFPFILYSFFYRFLLILPLIWWILAILLYAHLYLHLYTCTHVHLYFCLYTHMLFFYSHTFNFFFCVKNKILFYHTHNKKKLKNEQIFQNKFNFLYFCNHKKKTLKLK